MKEYIITEEQLHNLIYGWDCDRHPLSEKIRSHPYTNDLIKTIQMNRKDERERVLDELEYFVSINSVLIYDEESEESGNWISVDEIRAKISGLYKGGEP
jgi:hypothetical protein